MGVDAQPALLAGPRRSRLRSIVKRHDLIGEKPEGGIGSPIPIAELHFEGSSPAEDVHDGTDLTSPEIDLREIDGQGHHFEELKSIVHVRPSSQDVATGEPWDHRAMLNDPATANYCTLPPPFHRAVHCIALPVGIQVTSSGILRSDSRQ